MFCWFLKRMSCISQNLPWFSAATAAWAASGASLWKGSGLCLKKMRTLSGYSLISLSMVGRTRLQNGH
jgi:hypothetical protein